MTLSTLEQKVLINILVGVVFMDNLIADTQTNRQIYKCTHAHTYRSVRF